MASGSDGPIEIMVMAILGAFVGLLAGLMAADLFKFISMFSKRRIGGIVWAAYGAAAGALLFAFLAMAGGAQ